MYYIQVFCFVVNCVFLCLVFLFLCTCLFVLGTFMSEKGAGTFEAPVSIVIFVMFLTFVAGAFFSFLVLCYY